MPFRYFWATLYKGSAAPKEILLLTNIIFFLLAVESK